MDIATIDTDSCKCKYTLSGLSFFLLLFSCPAFSQPLAREPDSILVKQNRIRSISVYEYSFTERKGNLRRQYFKRFDRGGRILQKFDFAPGREAYRTEYNYDKFSGNLSSSLTYDPYEAGFYGTAYNYDESGKNTERAHFDLFGRLEYKNLYKYDENGHPLEQGTYALGSKFSSKDEYTYDTLGRLSDARLYYTDGKIACRAVYTYDEQNRPLFINRYDGNDSILSCKYSYRYDRKGNMLEEDVWTNAGDLKEKTAFQYDKRGDVSEQIFYSPAEKPAYRYKFKYRFFRKERAPTRYKF
jgi:hypothetical protein